MSLLPSNATALELDVETSISRPLPVDVLTLWNADTCPINFLPWLAWAFSLEKWNDLINETAQRQAVRNAMMNHARIGTPQALRDALAVLGYSNVSIIEHRIVRRNGSFFYDGSSDHHGGLYAYQYDLVFGSGALSPQLAVRDGSYQRDGMIYFDSYTPAFHGRLRAVRAAIDENVPARAWLRQARYSGGGALLDGALLLDGTTLLASSNSGILRGL